MTGKPSSGKLFSHFLNTKKWLAPQTTGGKKNKGKKTPKTIKNNKKPTNYWKCQVTARGARQGPSCRGCPSCWQLLPECWLCSPLPQTVPGCGGESWWQSQLSEPEKPAAGCPCFRAAQLLTVERRCPLGFFCATQWFRPLAQFLGCHQPRWRRKIGLLHLNQRTIRFYQITEL